MGVKSIGEVEGGGGLFGAGGHMWKWGVKKMSSRGG